MSLSMKAVVGIWLLVVIIGCFGYKTCLRGLETSQTETFAMPCYLDCMTFEIDYNLAVGLTSVQLQN